MKLRLSYGPREPEIDDENADQSKANSQWSLDVNGGGIAVTCDQVYPAIAC